MITYSFHYKLKIGLIKSNVATDKIPYGLFGSKHVRYNKNISFTIAMRTNKLDKLNNYKTNNIKQNWKILPF